MSISRRVLFKSLIAMAGAAPFASVFSAAKPIIFDASVISAAVGAPEGVVSASVGSLFMRTDDVEGSILYVKKSGSGNTGWVAK